MTAEICFVYNSNSNDYSEVRKKYIHERWGGSSHFNYVDLNSFKFKKGTDTVFLCDPLSKICNDNIHDIPSVDKYNEDRKNTHQEQYPRSDLLKFILSKEYVHEFREFMFQPTYYIKSQEDIAMLESIDLNN